MKSPRYLKLDAKHPIAIVETWNVPYSTGFYLLSQDDVPKEAVEKFAIEHAHFPYWPLIYQGKLWSKDTWDD